MREHEIKQVLNDAVRAAGALALDFYEKRPDHWFKANNTPVSEADIAVNDLLGEALRSALPDYGWLSEESQDTPERFERDRVWVVDPIDGTRAFLRGEPHWTISVALVEHGVPIMAAVFNPVSDEFYQAQADGGASLNDVPIAATDRGSLEDCKLIAHRDVIQRPDWPKPWPRLKLSMRNSMAYRVCLVAQGVVDGAFTMSAKSDWDLAAADLILKQAGGKFTNGEGADLSYNQAVSRHRPTIAAGPKLHGELLAYLR